MSEVYDLIAKEKFVQLFSLHHLLFWDGLWVFFQYDCRRWLSQTKNASISCKNVNMLIYLYRIYKCIKIQRYFMNGNSTICVSVSVSWGFHFFFFHFELVHLISLFKYSPIEFYFWFLFHSQWATHTFLSSWEKILQQCFPGFLKGRKMWLAKLIFIVLSW